MYFWTFAVVGTLSGKLAKYSYPPTCSNLSIDSNSSFNESTRASKENPPRCQSEQIQESKTRI